LRKLIEIGKCQVCGDKSELYDYNQTKTCASCLGMDVRGVKRQRILNKNIGKRNEQQIRRVRKKRW